MNMLHNIVFSSKVLIVTQNKKNINVIQKCGGDKKKTKLNPKEEGMEIGSERSHVSSFHINI